MRVRIMLQITDDTGASGAVEEVAVFEKATEQPEDLGLLMAEGKALLAAVQHKTVLAQMAAWSERHRDCEDCGRSRRIKGSYPLTYHTLFGDIEMHSQRLHACPCRGAEGPSTVSPLCDLLRDKVSPERLYLEARWASLVPYAATAELLAEVLPIAAGANAMTIRQHVLGVAERAEAELGEEQYSFIDGCPAQWRELPIPEGRIVVGLDGGYVRNWHDRKSNFELIVGRSLPEDRAPCYLGLVRGYDQKPKRRLFELLKRQGLQANQGVTFLTDGGEEVRADRTYNTSERARAGLVSHHHAPDRARSIRARLCTR